MVENNESGATAHINELVSHLLAKKYKCNGKELEAPKGQVLADLIGAVSKCTGLERTKIVANKLKSTTNQLDDVYYEGGHLDEGVKHGLCIRYYDHNVDFYGGCETDRTWKWEVYNEGEEIHSFLITEYHYDN